MNEAVVGLEAFAEYFWIFLADGGCVGADHGYSLAGLVVIVACWPAGGVPGLTFVVGYAGDVGEGGLVKDAHDCDEVAGSVHIV